MSGHIITGQQGYLPGLISKVERALDSSLSKLLKVFRNPEITVDWRADRRSVAEILRSDHPDDVALIDNLRNSDGWITENPIVLFIRRQLGQPLLAEDEA